MIRKIDLLLGKMNWSLDEDERARMDVVVVVAAVVALGENSYSLRFRFHLISSNWRVVVNY